MKSIVQTTLGDIAAKVVMGPFGSKLKTENFVQAGTPVIRGGNLTDSKFNDNGLVFVNDAKADELKSAWAFPLDIVITHRGTLGQAAIIPTSAKHKKYIVSQSQMKISIDQSKADPYFIYYFLNSPIGQQRLLANTSQVGVPAIAQPTGSIKAIAIDLPEHVEDQAEIARVLRSFDDKIELNRRLSETLESIAQALFQSWFVDFDPVRAKASGEAPESICQRLGLTTELLALFPDRLVESELGKVPEGWNASVLGDVIDIFDSKRVPLSNREREQRKGEFPYYGAASVMDYVDDYLFDGVFVLMGEDGSVVNPDGTPILQYVWDKFWVNNHAHVLQAKPPISNEQLLLFLRNTNIAALVTGAVQAKLSQGNLKRIPYVQAPDLLNQAFGALVAPKFELIRSLSDECRNLETARNALLPKLLAGSLQIPAEAQHESG